MTGSTSTALVPVPATPEPPKSGGGCGGKRTAMTARSKWLIFAAVVLGAGGLVLGSAVLGFAAILPLLFLIPCLVMVAMCMKGNGKGGASDGNNTE